MEGFKLGLPELGWLEGENISFDLRRAEGVLRRLPEFANEMVSAGVNAIAVIGAVTVPAIRQATSNNPIQIFRVEGPSPPEYEKAFAAMDQQRAGALVLSIETASHHELAINFAAARHLGVTVPPELLARAYQTVQ
jgi:ABC-type uncharacterized transport system substrate-binding protein